MIDMVLSDDPLRDADRKRYEMSVAHLVNELSRGGHRAALGDEMADELDRLRRILAAGRYPLPSKPGAGYAKRHAVVRDDKLWDVAP